MDDDPSKSSRVAIVGAGFAGLTLANYLSTHQWPCVELFDAKSEPIPIIGTIRLPHAKKVLEEVLGLQGIPPSNSIDHTHRHPPSLVLQGQVHGQVVPREDFLNGLRQNVTIRYSCRIVRVEQQRSMIDDDDDDGAQYFMMIDDKGQSHGPFDVVVAADGLFGQEWNSSSTMTAVMGDARWQYDMWFWDFGQTRIQRGGDIAICDGLELGQRLVKGEALGDKFAAKARPRIPNKLILLLPILLSILYRLILGLEKI
jgi:2-polyprenyl-6-methoxyphenol hydroxylase-like FAD-dependent oxidoreductase